MSLDPSLLLLVSLCGGLIHDYLQSGKEASQGIWAEWLAWLILIAAQGAPFLYKRFRGHRRPDDVEDALLESTEKTSFSWRDEIIPGSIAVCLVGAAYLQQSEHGRYFWALVCLSSS